MTERIMDSTAVQAYLLHALPANKVWRMRETDYVFMIEPAEERIDCTIGLRGMLAGYEELTVERFLERKHKDKELDL